MATSRDWRALARYVCTVLVGALVFAVVVVVLAVGAVILG